MKEAEWAAGDVPSTQSREQEFHDKLFADDSRERKEKVGKFYVVTETSIGYYRDIVSRGSEGNDVLDYGCGQGLWSFYLAERGANRVTGIDISEVAVEQAKSRLDFHVMDAEQMDFEDSVFDMVCGTAILHHLDIDKAYTEIARTLKPGGCAVFLEPLGHNPMINLYRRLTPDLRTEDEHPLLVGDIERAGKYFSSVEAKYFHLFSLLAVPFRNLRGGKLIMRMLNSIDQFVFRAFPSIRKFAWMVVLTMSEPKK